MSTACRNRCEEDVIAIDALRRRSSNLAQITSKLYYGIGAFFALTGALTFFGGIFSLGTKDPNPIGIVLGALFVLSGIGCFVFARRARK